LHLETEIDSYTLAMITDVIDKLHS